MYCIRFLMFLGIFLVSDWAYAAKPKLLKIAALEMAPYVTEQGAERGYFYEVVAAAFAEAGYKLDIQFYPAIRARKMVESGERDALIPSTAEKSDEKRFAFSQALNSSSVGIITLKGDSAGRRNQPLSSPSLETLEEREKILQMIDMLNQKRVDYIVADKLVAAEVLVSKRPHLVGRLEFRDPPLGIIDFHVAFSKRKAAYRERLADFDRALARMKKDGRYDRIMARYAVQEKSEDPRTLVIGTVNNADMKHLEELSPIFLKKHPNLKIQWKIVEENLLRKRISSSMALQEDAFDVITVGQFEALLYARKGWVETLETPRDGYEEVDLLPGLRRELMRGDRLYALPFYREGFMTYYRKDLFQKKGLTMPEQPDFDQLRHFAEKLHDPAAGVAGICMRGKAGWGENAGMIAAIVAAFGGKWFDGRWQPQLTSPVWHEAVNYYVDLATSFGPRNVFQNGYKESLKLFADGRCAIWVDASVAASFLADRNNSMVFDKIGYAKAPKKIRSFANGGNWTWVFAIPKLSGKKELAQEFMEWATSREYIELVAAKKGWLSVPPGTRLSTYENEAYRKAAPFSSIVLQIMHGDARPVKKTDPDSAINDFGIPELPALGNVLGSYVSDVLKSRRSVADALDLAQQEAKRIMYHSGYYSPAN